MTNDRQKALGDRAGVPFYKTNPSMPARGELQTRSRNVQIAKGGKAMVLNATGDILGSASVAFMQEEAVDQSRFIKLYEGGMQRFFGFSKAGVGVFRMVFKQMQLKPNEDQVVLSAYTAKEEEGIEQRTYHRGLRELLDKEALFASAIPSLFFVNIKFIFNGDRLHFIESYYLKRSASDALSQPELGLDDAARLD
jgi:hypothetical protein